MSKKLQYKYDCYDLNNFDNIYITYTYWAHKCFTAKKMSCKHETIKNSI